MKCAKGPSAEPFYQVSVHLVEGFKILKFDERQTPSHGESSQCLWQGELRKLFIKSNSAYNMMNAFWGVRAVFTIKFDSLLYFIVF
jgi:hypothetical protein